jgi:hypothetical protein
MISPLRLLRTTPTVFNGQVYVGTNGEIEVFGICPQSGCLP